MPAPGRALLLAATALLLCLLAFTGCTQPVIPSPVAEKTTMPTVATTHATAAPVTTVQATAAPDYLTYTNGQYGFTMVYPAAWNKQENTGTSVVVFSAPSQGMGDVPATMRVLVEDLRASPMGLEQYKNAQLARKQGLDKFNILHDLSYKGPNYNGWKVGYSYDAGTLIENFEIYIIRGTNVYTIAFSSKEGRFAGYAVPMDAMFKSFQLTG